MRLARLLSCVFFIALFAACATEATPPVASRPSPTSAVQTSPAPSSSPVRSPSPAAHPTQRPLVIPSPRTPFFRCDTPDLEMRLISLGAAAGNISATIEVRNKSQRDCDLYGYAGLQLLDAHGRLLTTRVIWSRTSFFLSSPAAETVVGLPPGTAPISRLPFDPMHPAPQVPGHAYIPLSFNDVVAPCSNAVQLRVTPPDAYQPVVISAVLPGGFGMDVCSGGTVWVNPTRVAATP